MQKLLLFPPHQLKAKTYIPYHPFLRECGWVPDFHLNRKNSPTKYIKYRRPRNGKYTPEKPAGENQSKKYFGNDCNGYH